MKKKLLRIFFAFIMFFSVLPTAHFYNNEETKINAANSVSGGYLYFDNTKTNWSDNYIYFCIGHNSYTSLYQMTKISNTNLYYCKMDKWDNSTYYAIIGTSSSWGSGNWGSSNLTNANHRTAAYTSSYNLNSGSYYLFTPNNGNNGCSLSISSKGSSYTSLNVNISLKSNTTIGGTANISGYKFSNISSTTSSNGSSGTSISIAISSKITLTATANTGYTFAGWYDNENYTGNAISVNATHTVSNIQSSITYYAKFVTSGTVSIYFDTSGVQKMHGNQAVYWPFIYYWQDGGRSVEWDDQTNDGKHRFTYTGIGNIWKYNIDFSKLLFDQIDYIIIAYYVDEDDNQNTHYGLKQTYDIPFSITPQDNGKEYRIVYEDQPNFTEVKSGNDKGKWKIDNFSFSTPVTLHYNDGNNKIHTSDTYYGHSQNYSHSMYFHEKEGYKLEGWYTSPTDFSDSNLFEKGYSLVDAPQEINLYANYIEAHDYYIYVDAKDMDWKTEFFSVYKWNEYFHDHNNAWPGVTSDITPLGNGMYKVFVDASKSFDKLIFCNIEDYDPDDVNNKIPQTEDIIMSPLNSYYVISPDTTTNSGGTNVQKIIYEQSLNNFLNAQKNLDYENGSAFRFAAGLQDYDDLVTEGKEFGFKFIFINGTTSYVGYWNFNPDSKFDCIRYVDELYAAGTPIEGISYNGFYVLTITDSITFNFNDYNQIIVVACYRDTNGETQVIKAKEFNVVGSGENIYLYELER